MKLEPGNYTEQAEMIVKAVLDAADAVNREARRQSIIPFEHGVRFVEVLVAAHKYLTGGRAIEIGTMHGLSAAAMALAGFVVDTWDVKTTRFAGPIWDMLGVREQMVHRLRFGALFGGPFDLAYIDAVHDVAHVKADYDEVLPLMDRPAVVIFDDIRFSDDVLAFVSGLDGFVDCGRFGYVGLEA